MWLAIRTINSVTFAPILIATLSTCVQLERDNISFRLQPWRKQYIEKGGRPGRKVGFVEMVELMKDIGSNKSAPHGIFHSGCGKVEWQGCVYGTASKM